MKDGAVPLLKKIRSVGMLQHYVLLGEGNMRRWDWEKIAGKLQGETRDFWKFFLLGEKFPEAEVVKMLGKEALGFLSRHQLCKQADGQVTLGTACLLSYRDHLFFADMGTADRTLFSDENRALITLLPKLTEGRCLSLYPTTGAEVLPIAVNPGVQVYFLQSDSKRNLLEANLEMGTPVKNYQFISKAQALKTQFDLIMASPPSCISVKGLPLPATVAGGPDGLRWVKECIRIAEKALGPHGEMAMIFMFFSDSESAAMEKHLHSEFDPFGLNYRMMVTSKMLLEPGVPIFNQLVGLSGYFNGKNLTGEVVVAKVMDYLKAKKYTGVYLIKAVFTKPNGSVHHEITNYSDDYYGTWTF